MSDDLIALPVSLLEHIDDLILAVLVVLDVHDGVVQLRVKLVARRAEFLDTELREHILCALEDQSEPLRELLGLIVLSGSLEVVDHRKHFLQRVRVGVGVDAFALLLAALSEVVVLGADPHVLVCRLIQILFRLVELSSDFGVLARELLVFFL